MQNVRDLEIRLFEELKRVPVIDAHDHLVPEKIRTKMDIDVISLFMMYSDLRSAGCKNTGLIAGRVKEAENMSIEQRWELFEPWYNKIKWGCYSRDTQIFLRDFYGINKVSKTNCREISEKLQENNKPGLYDSILKKTCNIESLIVHPHPRKNMTHKDYPDKFMRPLVWISSYLHEMNCGKIKELESKHKEKILDIESLKHVFKKELLLWKKENVIALKISSVNLKDENPTEEKRLFQKILEGEDSGADSVTAPDELRSSLIRYYCQVAAEENLPVAVHAGVWGDFRKLAPTNIIPLIQQFPDTRFDIFHAGIPYVRENGIMGKMFPNVTLNLCWCPLISETMMTQFLDEYIDLVPVNKISAFGADYISEVENVYGHWIMALNILAKVFARKIDAEIMDYDDAIYLGHMFLYENPKNIYNL